MEQIKLEVGKKVFPAQKSGRAFNGAHRDAGSIIHAVTDNSFPSWNKALCGVEPGRRGNGWHYIEDGRFVDCPKCLKKMSAK
jgi:hypothetical protein